MNTTYIFSSKKVLTLLGIMSYYLLTTIFLLLVSLHISGDSIKITASDSKIKYREPIFLIASGAIKLDKKKLKDIPIYLSVDGKRSIKIDRKSFLEFEMLNKEIGNNGNIRFKCSIVLFMGDNFNYIFSKPGNYDLRLFINAPSIKSNIVRINIQSLNKREKKISKRLYSRELFRLLGSKVLNEKTKDALRTLELTISDNRDLVHAKYLGYILFNWKYNYYNYADGIKTKKEFMESKCQHAALGKRYEEYISKLPKPSHWHANAYINITRCYAESVEFCDGKFGNKENIKRILKKIKTLYKGTKYEEKSEKGLEELKAK